MGLFVNSNVASLNAQRNVGQANRSLGRSFERLSSGLRINTANDDAAGLGISDRLTAQVRGLSQLSGIQMMRFHCRRPLVVWRNASSYNVFVSCLFRQRMIPQPTESLSRKSTPWFQSLTASQKTTFNNQNILDGSFIRCKVSRAPMQMTRCRYLLVMLVHLPWAHRFGCRVVRTSQSQVREMPSLMMMSP